MDGRNDDLKLTPTTPEIGGEMEEIPVVTGKPGKKPKPKEDDPRKKLVSLRLRRPDGGKGNGQFISVNNYRYFVPYNKTVEVPFFIAEIARLSYEQDERTREMIEDMASPD